MKIYDEEETVMSRAVEEPTVAAAGAAPEGAPEISLFLPVLNEEPNLLPLHLKIDEALARLGRTAEIIYVDDGSTDGGLEVLRDIARRDPRVRVVALRRNYGQTAAMAAGIDAARGKVLIPRTSVACSTSSTRASTWSRAGARSGRTRWSRARSRR
jgi:hypothetical protein